MRLVSRKLESIAVAVCAAAIGAAVFAACSHGAGTKADFAAIDEVAQPIALASLGTVKLDQRSGGRQTTEGQPATRTLVVLVSGKSPEATQAEIGRRLTSAGYTADSPVGALCGSSSPCRYRHPTNRVSVGLIVYGPGEQIQTGDRAHPSVDLVVPPNDAGFVVDLSKS